jgi:hypothetical protein
MICPSCPRRIYKMHEIKSLETGAKLDGADEDNVTWSTWTFQVRSSPPPFTPPATTGCPDCRTVAHHALLVRRCACTPTRTHPHARTQAEAAEALPAGISNVSSFLDLTQLVRARSGGALRSVTGPIYPPTYYHE